MVKLAEETNGIDVTNLKPVDENLRDTEQLGMLTSIDRSTGGKYGAFNYNAQRSRCDVRSALEASRSTIK